MPFDTAWESWPVPTYRRVLPSMSSRILVPHLHQSPLACPCEGSTDPHPAGSWSCPAASTCGAGAGRTSWCRRDRSRRRSGPSPLGQPAGRNDPGEDTTPRGDAHESSSVRPLVLRDRTRATCRWWAARTPRWARCTASSARRACACRTASRSPPRPIATRSTAAGLGRAARAPRRPRRPATWRSLRVRGRARPRARVRRRPAAGRAVEIARSLPAAAASSTATTWRSRCAARRPPRTCPTPASPASTRPSSTSRARRTCSTPFRRCFASLFTDRAIPYRIDQGFDHFKVALSVGVMKMVRADRRRLGRDVHARHRVRLPRRRLHHRRLRPGRERRPGRRRSRTSSTSTSRPSRQGTAPCCDARLGGKAVKMVYARRRHARTDAQSCRRRKSDRARFCIDRRRRARARRRWLGRSSDRLRPARWTSSGRRTGSTASCTSFRRGRRPPPPATVAG